MLARSRPACTRELIAGMHGERSKDTAFFTSPIEELEAKRIKTPHARPTPFRLSSARPE
jgi:hypothetical protein